MARNFLVVGGIVYLVLWIYGIAIDLDTDWNFVSLNSADNWLHLGLGAAMVVLGYAMSNMRRPATSNVRSTVAPTDRPTQSSSGVHGGPRSHDRPAG